MEQDISLGYDEFILKFKDMIKSLGLNNSVQREYVLKILFDSDQHLNAEELLHQVKTTYNVNIGIATVYRILNLLEDLNIVKSISINRQDFKVYELNLKPHHDHMVCIKCNAIVEFFDAELEKIQELVAQEKGFQLQSHTMMLYGVCKKCKEKEKENEKTKE